MSCPSPNLGALMVTIRLPGILILTVFLVLIAASETNVTTAVSGWSLVGKGPSFIVLIKVGMPFRNPKEKVISNILIFLQEVHLMKNLWRTDIPSGDSYNLGTGVSDDPQSNKIQVPVLC